MPTTTQFVVSGQSKPGVLAEVAAVLGAAGVNIKAFSAPEVTGPREAAVDRGGCGYGSYCAQKIQDQVP
jgi:glycine cleavage system regulatory protein